MLFYIGLLMEEYFGLLSLFSCCEREKERETNRDYETDKMT